MSENNFDDFKKYFEKEREIPESLSKENIVKMLKEENVKQKKNRHIFKKAVAVAAAFAIIGTGVFRLSNIKKPVSYNTTQASLASQKEYEKIDVGVSLGKVSTFESENDLKNHFLNLAKDYSNGKIFDIADELIDSVFFAAKESAEGAVNMAYSKPQAVEDVKFSETNKQTEGVDESDIVKNDGRYIYSVSKGGALTIVDTEKMQTVYSKELKGQQEKKTFDIDEIYLNGNRLVAVGREYDKKTDNGLFSREENVEIYEGVYSYAIENIKTACAVYDIADKKNPSLLRYVVQDGNTLSSRMIGTVMYMVTNYQVDITDKKSTEENYAPKVDGKAVTCNDVYLTEENTNAREYIVVSAFDTSKKDGEVNKVSLLGDSDEVYASKTCLYVTHGDYRSLEDNTDKYCTDIYAFSLDGTSVKYKGNGVVPGTVNNKYSLDEYNGFLRVATTNYDFNEDEDISSIYVLDNALNVIGSLSDFAKDEQVKSVRYMGQYGYVVTFKNTDPLFVVDFEDPSKPTIKGQVKLPGFSSYLHPVGEGLLLGIGYNGNEENADLNSIKVSLFDISNPESPKEIDSHIIKNVSSEINYDPKAFLYYPEENIIGIPLQYTLIDADRNYKGESYQYKLMGIENGKFTQKLNFSHPLDESGWYEYLRGAYIDKTLYTVTDLSIASFNMETGERTGFVEFATR